MDRAEPAVRSWAPSIGLVVLAWIAAAVAAVWWVVGEDAPGRLLAAVGAVGLVAAAVFGSVARPRLSVDDGGVTVRGLTGARTWPWRRVRRVRVATHRRLGRDIPMLELDLLDLLDESDATGPQDDIERLIVLGRLDLNADPDDVLDSIRALRGLT